ncbi:MAG: hypothetical protein HY277_04880 [Ignavibacteriales bacterium]|nr:hypothetical protein [Ignavibacteriales bacterium]
MQIEQADPLTIATDALIHLRRRSLEKMVEDNQRILKAASHRGENIIPFLERHQQLVEKIKELETSQK